MCDPHKTYASRGLHVAKEEVKQAYADLKAGKGAMSVSEMQKGKAGGGSSTRRWDASVLRST